MAAESEIRLVGNITRDPELRFTQSGQAVATFGLAVNRRWQNRSTQEWEEKVSFIDCTAWQQLAENIAETLNKGDRVLVTGRLDQQSWEDKETGAARSKLEVVIEEIGPSLKYATASITKNPKKDGFASNQPPMEAREASAPAGYSNDEEPFVVDVADWWPQVGLGSHPKRMLR